jgi:hypothetical protein
MATQEAEIRRIEVQSQPDGVAQGVGPEFKPQNLKKKRKKRKKTRAKWTESMAQAVENLLCKCNDLFERQS